MTYHDPKKQIPIMLDSNAEMYKAMQSDKIKINDLEKIWLELFQSKDGLDGMHVVECQRMLYQSALSALQEFNQKDFKEKAKEKELSRELSYDDAAKFLECSVRTIKRLVNEGKLSTKKYNSKVVKITMGELERFRSAAVIQ